MSDITLGRLQAVGLLLSMTLAAGILLYGAAFVAVQAVGFVVRKWRG